MKWQLDNKLLIRMELLKEMKNIFYKNDRLKEENSQDI